MRPRRGMALAMTIGVVSLIAILAVATLSLAGRLVQTSTLGVRDARLDAGAAFGLAEAVEQWRLRHVGRLAIGASISFEVKPSGIPISVSVAVTRVSTELFWVVADATAPGGGARRESLILRGRAPDQASLLADDSTNVTTIGFVSVDSLAATADLELPFGSALLARDGLIHIAGDATLTGGSASGILIVDGRLTIIGALSFEGIIVAKGGISVVVPGVTVRGLIRVAGAPLVAGSLSLTPSASVAQDVLLQVLTPTLTGGRRWAEMQ